MTRRGSSFWGTGCIWDGDLSSVIPTMMEKIPAVPVNLNSFRSSAPWDARPKTFLRGRAYLNEEMLSYTAGSFGSSVYSD